MKKNLLSSAIIGITFMLIIAGCSPITLTSWVNPKEHQQVSKIAVWGMFDKLEYQKPFEQAVASYLNSKGIKSMEALSFIAPGKKYPLSDLEAKFDSAGADGILIVNYKSTDKEQNYVPPTTMAYPDFYYNYYNYYAWGYPYYAPGASVVTTGGYWVTTSVINITANLYANSDNALIWTADISIQDPSYIDEASYQIAGTMYADWVKNGLLKFPEKAKK
ncbi:MAG: hypothetical protein NTX43_10460 [Bacteroidetes bacterium]|nr:hypothetical protein [Bacteroidota bacterium]